ncbi:MAG: ligand-binding sensor domain-containing protein, partial [Terracidiphilus sp.]
MYFQQLDSADGLAQDSVSLIFQDHKGFMWFATQGGLFRYDGYTLTRYAHDPNRSDSLPDDYLVTSLADAGDGRLWVGSSSGGLILLDPEADKVIPLPPAVQRDNLPVTSLLELPDSDVLIGSELGLDRLTSAPKPHLQRVWSAPHGMREPVKSLTRCPDGSVYASAGSAIVALDASATTGRILTTTGRPVDALYCDARNKRLLLGNANGLASVDRKSGALVSVWRNDGNNAIGVRAIAVDHAGRIWLGLSDHSLLRLSPNGSEVRVVPAPAGISGGLPDSRIDTLFIDHTGLLWAGTLSAGVVWTHPDANPIQAVLNLSGDPRVRTYVRAFRPTADGRYWIAMSGPGLVRYDPVTSTVTSFGDALAEAVHAATGATASTQSGDASFNPDWRANGISTLSFGIVPEPDGTLLLPSNHGILHFDPATGKATYATLDEKPATTPAHALYRARNGDLWVAPTDDGLVHYHAGHAVQHFDSAHGLASDSVLVIDEDSHGKVWAGTTHGVSMIDPATGKVRTFREVPGRHDSLAGSTVISLLVTKAGQVWIGSLSGISRLRSIGADGAHFQRYGLGDGLPDNTIDCMLEDATGNIWFSTNLGIGRLTPKTGAVRTFNVADGLQGSEYNSGACLRAANGDLLFGGHGFTI